MSVDTLSQGQEAVVPILGIVGMVYIGAIIIATINTQTNLTHPVRNVSERTAID